MCYHDFACGPSLEEEGRHQAYVLGVTFFVCASRERRRYKLRWKLAVRAARLSVTTRVADRALQPGALEGGAALHPPNIVDVGGATFDVHEEHGAMFGVE